MKGVIYILDANNRNVSGLMERDFYKVIAG